jgi:hypothetical protein
MERGGKMGANFEISFVRPKIVHLMMNRVAQRRLLRLSFFSQV